MDTSYFQRQVDLSLDYPGEIRRVCDFMTHALRTRLKRRGFVVAISGGIDSSVCAALAVNSLGPSKVLGLLLPEADSSGESTLKGVRLAEHLGIDYLQEDITPALEAMGCYRRRDEAIRQLFPDYRSNWKNKIAINSAIETGINHFKLVVQDPQGEMFHKVMPLKTYLAVVAATNFKQRVRKTFEYFHADRLNYAVVGTPNRLEFDQGFFVKNGDGSADIKPIAHLYKTQVYAMARALELPESICNSQPTTDTYSLEQGQDEFYFALPYQQMDIALWCYNNKVCASTLAEKLEVSTTVAQGIYRDIEAKRKSTSYLHERALKIENLEVDM